MNRELVESLRTTGKEDLLAELEFDHINTRYFFTRQRQLLGLGHAVLCARSFVGNQPFVVALGDSIIGLNAQSDVVNRMQACFVEHQPAAVIAFEEVSPHEASRYGIALPESDGNLFRLADIVEKPAVDDAPSNLAVAARYIFTPDIFEALEQTSPDTGGEIQLTDAIRTLIADGKTVYGVRLGAQERRYDIGNFEAYFRAFIEFALADTRHGEDLRGYLRELLG
jgi:UTP--glucose-1-phosphate uridylyltransferase